MRGFISKFERSSRRGTDNHVVARRGFTLVEVLVSMAVIAVLLAIMLPAVRHVNETANRVVCRSNIRQIGLAFMMYADQNKGEMPRTQFIGSFLSPDGISRDGVADRPQETMTLRLDDETRESGGRWDGLGQLFATGYLSAPQIFYCPSHHGEFPASRFIENFGDESTGPLIGNFQYRGQGPIAGRTDRDAPRTSNLFKIDPSQTSLIADGMRTVDDINHRVGANFFRADQSVMWFGDKARLESAWTGDDRPGEHVNRAWSAFDDFIRTNN